MSRISHHSVFVHCVAVERVLFAPLFRLCGTAYLVTQENTHTHTQTLASHVFNYAIPERNIPICKSGVAYTYRDTTRGSQSPPQYFARTGSLVLLPS